MALTHQLLKTAGYGLEDPPVFRLDTTNECAWLGAAQISLSPKAFSVLLYLARRPGTLVTKQELLDNVWPEVHATEGVSKRAVLEIGKALSDSAEEARFIQTRHRWGYCFLVHCHTEPSVQAIKEPRKPLPRRRVKPVYVVLRGWPRAGQPYRRSSVYYSSYGWQRPSMPASGLQRVVSLASGGWGVSVCCVTPPVEGDRRFR